MIINHKYKFIFIKTQKTASTSMEIALSALCNENDIVTPISVEDEKSRNELGFCQPVNYKFSLLKYTRKELLEYFFLGTKKKYSNHISCKEIQDYIGKDIYADYYKFCFERNPYDKAISLFYHEGGFERWDSIEAFINEGGLKIIKGYDQYSINKIIAVDDIFKYENMSEALITISEKLNLKIPLELPKKKAKGAFRKDKRHYNVVLSEAEKQLISIIWARERELMGYEF